MLRTPKKFVFDSINLDSMNKEFTLRPNDQLEFKLFANDGYKLVDILGDASTANAVVTRNQVLYEIGPDGMVTLPLIGSENLAGMTMDEAKEYLSKRYSEFYVKPFIVLKVINRRVIIYPGEPGTAKVIQLDNTNVTVLEAIALAGGISANGKAKNIKLIRRTDNPKKPTMIYKLDLSRIDGLAEGNIVLQTNDIIYVQPRQQVIRRSLGEVTPALSLITSLVTFYYLISRLP